jgi:uncharacterized protein YdiU (UPF0061 family)
MAAEEADGRLLEIVRPAFASALPEYLQRRWAEWMRTWLGVLSRTAEDAGAKLDAAAVSERMRSANPKYVPREWMLVQAYTAAEGGEYGPLHTLLEVLTRPYDEQPRAARFYRPAPEGSELQGGVGFMS